MKKDWTALTNFSAGFGLEPKHIGIPSFMEIFKKLRLVGSARQMDRRTDNIKSIQKVIVIDLSP